MRPAALLACLMLLAPAARADDLNTPGAMARTLALLVRRLPAGAAISGLRAVSDRGVVA